MIIRNEIIDYFKEYEKLPKALPRELKVPLDSDFIISIIGPRRAGKTYYLFWLSEKVEDFVYFNFEDSRLMGMEGKEIRALVRIFIEIYGKEPKYLFLDEIQNVKGWEGILREMHDLRKYRIFIAGSSSKLLSKEIATQLRGRSLSYILLPLSFREFLNFKNFILNSQFSKNDEAKIKNLLLEYLEYGGFPDVVRNEEKTKILKEYNDLILFRDFIERHKIRNIEVARFLHNFMIQNFSNEVSIRSLFNKLKQLSRVGKDTVYEYVSKLEDTMFFFFLRRFSSKIHLREGWPKKVYLCDTGLTKIIRYSQDYGKLMENVFFLELKRIQNENPLIEIFYLKINNKEVDFIVKEGLNIKQLIQVTYASAKDEIEKREINSLIKASDLLKCKNLLIITWDYEDVLKVNDREIKIVPLWKTLITKNFIE